MAINNNLKPGHIALVAMTLRIKSVNDAAGAQMVERVLHTIPGVTATVNFGNRTAHLLAPTEIRPKEIVKVLKSAGYTAQAISPRPRIALHNRNSTVALFFATLFAVAIDLLSLMQSWHPKIDRWINLQNENFNITQIRNSPTSWLLIALTIPVILLVAAPIHISAIRHIFRPSADLLISLASFIAFGWSAYANFTGIGNPYPATAATLLLIVIAGRFLESLAMRRTSRALAIFIAQGSTVVTVLRSGELVLISLDDLRSGDEFIAKAGEIIAADGIIISGQSATNNATLLGKFISIDVGPGSQVLGSSLNVNAQLLIKATRNGNDTEIARMTRLLVLSQSEKAPIQGKADLVISWLTPLTLLLAGGVFYLWRHTHHSYSHSIAAAIATLLASSLSALALVSPMAIQMAAGKGALQGIVMHNSTALRSARKIGAVVFDIPGILTQGHPSLAQICIAPEAGKALGPQYHSLLNEPSLLISALAIAQKSSDPLLDAISTELTIRGIASTEATEFRFTEGTGAAGRVALEGASPIVLLGSPKAIAFSSTPFHSEISAAVSAAENDGLKTVVLAWDGVALAVFSLGDEIKADAPEAIGTLQSRGIEPWLITSKSTEFALRTAHHVGIPAEHVIGGASAAQKVELVKALQSHKFSVLMVGDGAEDPEAMAAANLSCTIGTGSDSLTATADFSLMRPGLSSVIAALDLSSRARRILKANFALALVFNAVALPLAALGILNPIGAVSVMAFAALCVTGNSLRVR